MKKTIHKKTLLITTILTLLAAGLIYYLMLPPLNLKSAIFWIFLLLISGIFCTVYYIGMGIVLSGKKAKANGKRYRISWIPAVIPIFILVLMLLILFFGSAKLFHAKAYSRILKVSEGTAEDLPSIEGSDSIALMDTASAEKLGNREIGSLSSVVSQYNVSEYTQIDYQSVPVKVSPLQYAGFFKWNRNRSNGIPGYVIVNPVSMDADYISMEQGMTYVPSAYFQEDLNRHIRFQYPTVLYNNIHFEIDEEGNPWYVASVYEHSIGLFGGTKVTGCILINPVDGSMELLETGEIPQWVDVVFYGNLICNQYNNYAQLHDGFWNSLIGQNGCRKVTEFTSSDEDEESYSDYGYIAKDGDIWIYTGVTSLNNDSSNIGFILSNERTSETIFITCAGADEFSAMASAEGEVQEKGYQASFPSLILLDGRPTYIMVLKDASGLVKMYAAVNVEQYNMVATAATQEDCIQKYNALVTGKISQQEATDEDMDLEPDNTGDSIDTSSWEKKNIIVTKLQTIDQKGDTYLYLVDEEQNIYSTKYADVLGMLLVEEGEEISILTDGITYRLTE